MLIENHILFSTLRSFVQHLEIRLSHTTLSHAISHTTSILTKATPLVRRLLNPSGINKVEGALIFIVIISVLTTRTKLRLILVCNQN